ncbi:MAG: lipoate--protein ligase family protein [Desulfurococcales archaeon]|nr:lipoate--protein ligase family protein [Desulfurococcales archaeon]
MIDLIVHEEKSPPLNLAIEESLLHSVCQGRRGVAARIWVNASSIVIGRTLKYCEEVDCGAAERLGLGVYRRITGGGAVYHDEGNINLTIIWPARGRIRIDEIYRRGTSVMVRALSELGLRAWVENTNDVIVDGWKVSGSAAYASACASLFHATLLVEADIGTLRSVLKPRLERVARGEVTPAKYNPNNLRDIAGVRIPETISSLRKAIRGLLGEYAETPLTSIEYKSAYDLYLEKYSRKEWNMEGKRPACTQRVADTTRS